MPRTERFDLVVIGAGSGGVAASRRAALHGAKVAVVEASRVGGTCVIRGCVPKKLLMYAAAYGDALRDARGYGWDIPDSRFEMPRWAAAKAAEITRLEGVYRKMLGDGDVRLVEGHARLDGPHRVLVATADGDVVLEAEQLLLATGASPSRDTIPGIDCCPTSDELLELRTLPPRAAVIGAGYIGIEFAAMLARLGVAVSVYYRSELPLRGFDPMLRQAAAGELEDAGIALHPERSPCAVRRDGDGYVLSFDDGTTEHYPWVLNATGRRPNTAGLGLDSLGLALDRHGAVPVDDRMRTGVDHVHAIGDLNNRKNLTPVAIAQGRAVADMLFGPSARPVDLNCIASAVFMLPPIGTLGPTEADALAEGYRIAVWETDFRPMQQAFIGGSQRTRLKLIADADSDRVLAVHMIGADAAEIIQGLAVALTAGATKADFDATMAVHPTAAEEFVLLRSEPRIVEPAAAPKVRQAEER